ncbi:MAG: hypothetical protein EOQ50_05365 [Mesorhizobium sp.]|uniref:hypothetical protein n=1 Tax=Mesorhizobium sp. TaxID=1871066 RepID=UPI000FE5F088|nr:hypothetical protein [Mesorhizobium sp.]RWB77487.1 MAG: hypothetical protein EOQ50_05365 [Mesorhizobium sp.]
MADLPAQLADAEARLEAAKKMAGVAVLEGRDIDHMAMAAIEAEITSIHAAGGEIARREREAAATAERSRIASLEDKLKRLNSERYEAATKAQEAAEQLCEQIKLWLGTNRDCARVARSLNPKNGAGILDNPDTEIRISRMLAHALKPVSGLRRRFGLISFPEAPLASGDWAETEKKITEAAILAVLKGDDAW